MIFQDEWMILEPKNLLEIEMLRENESGFWFAFFAQLFSKVDNVYGKSSQNRIYSAL